MLRDVNSVSDGAADLLVRDAKLLVTCDGDGPAA
jgi:hypothetical protein